MSSYDGPHPDLPTSPDVLSSSAEAGPARRRGLRTAAVAAAALLSVGVGGAAVWGATALGGGGAQPEDVLPAGALAFVKLDLDPAAGQKVAAYRLARQFPDSGVTGSEDLRDRLLRHVFPESGDVDYAAHVEPWLGQRAGLAVLAPRRDRPDDEPDVVLAVQATDREAAQRSLTSLASAQESAGRDVVRWALAPDADYVLLGEEQAAVDAAAGAQEQLADDEDFDRAVQALEGDQIGLVWADLGAFWDAVPEQDRGAVFGDLPDVDLGGSVVLGARAVDEGVEVAGATVGLTLGDTPELRGLLTGPLGRPTTDALVQELPADSVFAMGLTGTGEGLADLFDTFAAQLDPTGEARTGLEELGLRLPEDLEVLLGTETALSIAADVMAQEPRVDVRVRSREGERAVEALRRVLEEAEPEDREAVGLDVTEDGYRLTYGGAGTGRLGDEEGFRRAVPDGGTGGMTYYLDVQRLLALVGGTDDLTPAQQRSVALLQGFGYTATSSDDGDVRLRLRLTIGD